MSRPKTCEKCGEDYLESAFYESHVCRSTPSTKPGTFWHPKEADYIFLREANGGDRMICEVRGVGGGMYEKNVDLLVSCMNFVVQQSCKQDADGWEAEEILKRCGIPIPR